MKRPYTVLLALLLGTTALTSCLKDDDDDGVTYSDVTISGFTLGTLNRYTTSTSASTGNDTIIKSTLTGSNYKMTIDHLTGTIYNQTPLPVGTDTAHVVCTITTKNSGLVALMSATSDSLRWHASTDSVNFGTPRTFRVYANDGSAYRDYTVTLNVSPTTGITFGWRLVKTDAALAGWDTSSTCLVAQGDSIVMTARGDVIGTATREQYKMSDGQMMFSRDGGQTWLSDACDDADELLPDARTAAIVSWDYPTAPATDYVLMVGTPRQDSIQTMRVWRKITPHEGGGQWVYMPFDVLNHYPLQRQAWISMTHYDDCVLAVGSDMTMLQSRDQGITWRTDDTHALPSSAEGTAVLLATDTQGRLWMLTNSGQLWEGALR